MDESTPNTRKKRPRSSGRNNSSFMNNITSTVSNILSPFVKWFSSPSASKDNDQTQKADATDSSSEEEVSPPPKKICYNSTEIRNHIGQSEVCYSTSTIASIKPSIKKLKRELLNDTSTPNHSITNELPKEENEQDYKNTNIDSQQSFPTVNRQSVIRKRKSFFDTFEESSSDLPKNKKFANKVKDSDETINATLLGSPFYPGKTSYGGASAYYMNRLNVDLRKPPVFNSNSSFDDSSMSQSAKRVMNLLENYSSPLSEARRISQFINSTKCDNLSTNMKSNKSSSYKTQELLVPNIASILCFEKKKRNSGLMDTTSAARQIIASHSSTIAHKPYSLNRLQREPSKRSSDRYISKITNKKMLGISDINIPVELPSAVLEIDQSNMPNFNIGNAEESESLNPNVPDPVENSSTISSDNTINGDTEENNNKENETEPEDLTINYGYTFSMPLTVSKDTLNSSISETLLDNPDQDNEKTEVSEQQDCSVPVIPPSEIDSDIVTKELNEWKCPDCWINNKADASNCVCCSAKKPTEKNKTLLKCLVCKNEINQEIVGNLCPECETAQKINIDNKLPLPAPSEILSWKCDDCWVKNDVLAEKCICCGGKNPEVKDIENEITEQKCENNQDNQNNSFTTCGENRPDNSNNKPVTVSFPSKDQTSTFKTHDNPYVKILKEQTSTWECAYCLANNNNNTSKCICCEGGKPNADSTKIRKFNFGINANTFKFGIDDTMSDPNQNIEAEQMSINEEWETNNNVLAKTPTFKFGISTQTTEDEDKKENLMTNVINEVPEVPKFNFNFGISKQTIFEQPNSSNLLKYDGNQQESIFTFTENLPGVSKPQDNTFIAKPLNLITDEEDTQNMLTEDKNCTFKPLTIRTTGNNEVNTPCALNFCNSGVKIATNLFNLPSVTKSTAVTSDNSLIMSPLTNTAPLLEKSGISSVSETPMFQKTNTFPMFQIPETKSVETTPSLPTQTKLFNFGHNQKSSMSLPETPKFNFNFGNTQKTEAPQMFNATFGVSTNPNSVMNSNKFTFTSSNMVEGNLSLLGSSLGNQNIPTRYSMMDNNLLGTNGLSIGNPLGITESSMCGEKQIKSPSSHSSTVSMFGETSQKDNLWTNTKNTPLFVSNANTLQSPPTFSFGIPTSVQVNNSGSIFGNNSSNIFSIQNQNSNLPSLFKSSNQNPTATNFFGNPQPTNTSPSAVGVFPNPNMSMSNNFSIPNPTMPTFEAPSQNSMPTQSFNFGTPQQTSGGVFGFGQQSPQPFQNHVYNFGSNQSTPIFTMGSSHNTSVRRVRKAVRRSSQR